MPCSILTLMLALWSTQRSIRPDCRRSSAGWATSAAIGKSAANRRVSTNTDASWAQRSTICGGSEVENKNLSRVQRSTFNVPTFNVQRSNIPTFQRSTFQHSNVQRSTFQHSNVQRSTFQRFNVQRSTFQPLTSPDATLHTHADLRRSMDSRFGASHPAPVSCD